MRNKNLILNYVFLSCVIVLFINDHFFKFQYTSWFTGKLSDAVGIILLPMLVTFAFPKLKENSVFASGLFFIFWKSPFSESFIRMYNAISPIDIHRVIDYSDLIVLLLLPIPYFLIKNDHIFENFVIRKIHAAVVLFPTVFVLMSTSQSNGYTYSPETGKLTFRDFNFEMKKTESDLLMKLEEQHIKVVKDTLQILHSLRYEISAMGKFDQGAITKGGDIFKVDNAELRKRIEERIYYSSDYKIKELKIGERTVKNISFSIGPAYNKINAKKFIAIKLHELEIDKRLDDDKVAASLREIYQSAVMSSFKSF